MHNLMNNTWFVTIVGGLIVCVIYELIRPYIFFFPSPIGRKPRKEKLIDYDNGNKTDIKVLRRNKLNDKAINVLLYVLDLFILCGAIYSPLIIKSLLEKRPIFLDEAKRLGGILPHLPVGPEGFPIGVIIIAVIVFIPLIYLSKIFSKPVLKIVDYFVDIKENTVRLAEYIFYVTFSLIVSGFIIWEFYEKQAKEAFSLPFIVFIVGIILLSVNKKPTQ